MSEQKIEVKVYRIEYVCDECKEGVMRLTDFQPYVDTLQYICSKCSHVMDLDKKYPRTVYEPTVVTSP